MSNNKKKSNQKQNNNTNAHKGNNKSIIKKILIIIICIAVVIVFSIPFIGTSFAEVANRNGISLAATSAYIYAPSMETEIWSVKPDNRYNPASTTKLLTCLLAVENLKLSDEVDITKAAVTIPDNYPTLQVGERFTVEDLLYLALMESVNEAAKQLAIMVSGSESKFAELMNEKALQVGCTNSVFHNASGVTADKNYATAHDIAMIAYAAFSNPTIREICSTEKHTIHATAVSNPRELENTNLLLTGGDVKFSGALIPVEKDPVVICGKTGTSLDGKATMAIMANINGIETIITILNSTQDERYNDLEALIDYSKHWITPYTAIEKGTKLDGEARVKFGEKNHVEGIAMSDAIVNLPEGASASLISFEYQYSDELQAPIEEGQVIGIVNIFLADELLRTVEICASEKVDRGWFLSRFYISNFATIIIGLVILFILFVFIYILYLRRRNRRMARERREAKLREIARQQMERERDVREREWPYL